VRLRRFGSDEAGNPTGCFEREPSARQHLRDVASPLLEDLANPLVVLIQREADATNAVELGLVDELRMFRNPVVIGGGTPFLPPVTEDVPLDLIETRTFGSRVIYERYRRVRDDSD
jgi:dihydrofolate reductase